MERVSSSPTPSGGLQTADTCAAVAGAVGQSFSMKHTALPTRQARAPGTRLAAYERSEAAVRRAAAAHLAAGDVDGHELLRQGALR